MGEAMRDVVLALAISLMVAGAAYALYRRAMRRAYDRIDRILDLKEIAAIENRDTRDAKLLHKAQRLRDVYEADALRQQAEMAQVQRSISDMSHQMKTPLASITMYADLLQTGDLTPREQRDCVDRMQTGASTLRWMADGLIKMSRLESGAVALHPENHSIRDTIASAVAGCLALADARGIEIMLEEFADAQAFHDVRWTCEALSNVLENAIKYAQQDTQIHVRVERLALYTRISIANQGISIPRDEWGRIFQRFYRGQNASVQQGSGLGLYLTRVILEKQGGYIMVDESTEAQTSFSLFLQICKK